MQFDNVTVLAKANIYFEGKVVSHTVMTADGKRHTLGVILPGTSHFGTEAPERMLVTAGACQVMIDEQEETNSYVEGESFDVPGKSGFTITVGESGCQYVCSFLS